MKPCTNCARPGKLVICEECAYRAEDTLRPLTPWTRMAEAAISPDNAVLREEGFTSCFKNSRYTVWVRKPSDKDGTMIHLSIKRNDRNPVHDWRDLQRIKNEILGAEEEAVEIYPAESRLVDGANQYHLWSRKGMRLTYGFETRCVMAPGSTDGSKQRPFEDPPPDMMTEDQYEKMAAEHKKRAQERMESLDRIKTILAQATARTCEHTPTCVELAPDDAKKWCAPCVAWELRANTEDAEGDR
jgi:hypothetical protein